MSRYAIIDAANLFYRIRHVVRGDAFTKAGMALHLVFQSIRKMCREQQIEHVVLCLEGGSWRYEVYPNYKAKRREDRRLNEASLNEREREENEVFDHAFNDFISFMSEKTRCTVLHSPGIEGDDFIARWVQLHPEDEHVILSGDSDFIQLLAPNVSIFNGVDNRLVTTEGVFDGDTKEPFTFHVNGRDGKLKVGPTFSAAKKLHNEAEKKRREKHVLGEKDREASWKAAEARRAAEDPAYIVKDFTPVPFEPAEFSFQAEPEWWRKALFVKCVRGDTGDSIFSAFPGVRFTSKTIGIQEAWDDRNGQGFHWNNFMLQTWDKLLGMDTDGNRQVKEVRVLDEYATNQSLIDLTMQPQRVKDLMDEVIIQATQKEPVGNVGMAFLQFCRRNDLNNLSRDAADHAKYLNHGYSQ